MAPDQSRWIRWLLHVAALRASEEALGDVVEEYAGRNRSVFWLVRQLLSTVRRSQARAAAVREGRVAMLSSVWSDIRYTLRTFRRSPGFAVAAIAPIALGVGINTGLFSMLDSVLLRPLPTPQSTELVSMYQDFQGVHKRRVHGARSLFSFPEYEAYRDGTQTMAGLLAYSRIWPATLGGQAPAQVGGVLVSCNYFDVLRVPPVVGRGFTPADCLSSGSGAGVVLSHALWTQAFGADPDVVQQTILLNGRDVAVLGVAPRGFAGVDLERAAFFVPIALQPVLHPGLDYREAPQVSWLTLIGRRAAGADLPRVRAELAVVAAQIDQQQPGRTTTLSVEPATSLSRPFTRQVFVNAAMIVLAAFGMVLLVAAANVANVLLARATGRTREVAIRLAVGASRRRLIQQLLTESLAIALIGGTLGSVLAWWSFQELFVWLSVAMPGTIPETTIDMRPNLTVLWFALGLTVTTALVFGMVPALQGSRQDLQIVLKQDSAGAGRRTGGWLRGSLIGVQVAVCMVLLIAAGLLLRALYTAQTMDPGFEYRQVAMVSLDLRGTGHDDDKKIVALQEQLTEQIRSLPGVVAAAHVEQTPLSPGRTQDEFRLPDQQSWHEVDVNAVSHEYFSILGLPIVRGRTFGPRELGSGAGVAIVTEATARRHWPGLDPIGRTIVMGRGSGRERPLEVIGVARDAHVSRAADAPSSYMYLPAAGGGARPRGVSLLVRSPIDIGALTADIRTRASALSAGVVVRVNLLETNLESWRAEARLAAGLSGALGLLALALASIGVYAVVAYMVGRRRHEVSIRMVLGANGRDVQGMLLRQTLRPVAVGVIVGFGCAAAAARLLESVLFGVSPYDPLAFIGAPMFLVGVAVLAAMVPCRRALKADPMSTLRID